MEWLLIPITIGLLLFAYVGGRARTQLERRRELASAGRCLACGSSRLQLEGETARCEDCGYKGRRDGGGALDTSDRRALIRSEPEV